MLTQERLKEVLHYDPKTGNFTRLVRTSARIKIGDIAGSNRGGGRRQISVNGKIYLSSRLAWLYMTGAWPANQIDHKNGVRGDDRFSNLRDVDGFINQQNRRRAQNGNKTGLLGAHVARGRYESRIMVNGKNHWLGSYQTAELAHAAYLKVKRKFHPGCTI